MIKKCCLETIYVEVRDDNIEQVAKDITEANGWASKRFPEIESNYLTHRYLIRWREGHLAGPVVASQVVESGKIYVRLNMKGHWQWIEFEPESFYSAFAVQEDSQ